MSRGQEEERGWRGSPRPPALPLLSLVNPSAHGIQSDLIQASPDCLQNPVSPLLQNSQNTETWVREYSGFPLTALCIFLRGLKTGLILPHLCSNLVSHAHSETQKTPTVQNIWPLGPRWLLRVHVGLSFHLWHCGVVCLVCCPKFSQNTRLQGW